MKNFRGGGGVYYYYLCDKCQYHAAFYDLRHHCPNCGADEKVFKILTDSEDPEIRQKISALVQEQVDHN